MSSQGSSHQESRKPPSNKSDFPTIDAAFIAAQGGYDWLEHTAGSTADPHGLKTDDYAESIAFTAQNRRKGEELDPATDRTQLRNSIEGLSDKSLLEALTAPLFGCMGPTAADCKSSMNDRNTGLEQSDYLTIYSLGKRGGGRRILMGYERYPHIEGADDGGHDDNSLLKKSQSLQTQPTNVSHTIGQGTPGIVNPLGIHLKREEITDAADQRDGLTVTILVQASVSVELMPGLWSENVLDMALVYCVDQLGLLAEFGVGRVESFVTKDKPVEWFPEIRWSGARAPTDCQIFADLAKAAIGNASFTRSPKWTAGKGARLENDVIKSLVQQAKEKFEALMKEVN